MEIARVTATVVATRKCEELNGYKLLLVEFLNPDMTPKGGKTVAVDQVDAGIGEIVLIVQGSSARRATTVGEKPVDAAVVAVIDEISSGRKTLYKKG